MPRSRLPDAAKIAFEIAGATASRKGDIRWVEVRSMDGQPLLRLRT